MNRVKIYSRKKLCDDKGWFLKVIDGQESDIPCHTGEVYVICGEIGESRAGHYHPEANEWFTVIQGKAELLLTDTVTKEQRFFVMDADNPRTIFVPNYIAHSVRNIGTIPFVLIAYSDMLYNPRDTVKY